MNCKTMTAKLDELLKVDPPGTLEYKVACAALEGLSVRVEEMRAALDPIDVYHAKIKTLLARVEVLKKEEHDVLESHKQLFRAEDRLNEECERAIASDVDLFDLFDEMRKKFHTGIIYANPDPEERRPHIQYNFHFEGGEEYRKHAADLINERVRVWEDLSKRKDELRYTENSNGIKHNAIDQEWVAIETTIRAMETAAAQPNNVFYP